MSSIDVNLSSVTGAPPTPAEQAEAALVGTPNTPVQGETAQEQAEATLVDLSRHSTGTVSADIEAGVPADMTAASALVASLAGEITGQGSQASSAYSLLSADDTLKLTTRS